MTIRLSAPSKTFLTGEYAVLHGGPALVINSAPRFSCTATQNAEGLIGIPDGSPARLWIKQRGPLLSQWKLEFTDPHNGQGGFGASSAQFLFVHVLTTLMQVSVSRALDGLDCKAMWNDFQVLTGGRASGADLLAQAAGQLAIVDMKSQSSQGQPWPYPDLDFAVLRTRNKVQTHVHLNELNIDSLKILVPLADAAANSFGIDSGEKFLQHVKHYADQLSELGLQTEATQQWLARLQVEPWSKVCKGCGALGADTVVVFFATADRPEADAFFFTQGWEAVAYSQTLSPGLQMQWSWD